MKLYLDEQINPLVAKILRDKGYDVISAFDIKATGLSDIEQFELSIKYERPIVTYDIKDFIDLSREYIAKGKSHFGIILINSKGIRQEDFKSIIQYLEKFLEYSKKEKYYLLNKIIFLGR